MGRWWERTDGEPGLSSPAAVLVGVAAAVGLFTWAVVTGDGPIDGDLVGATAAGLLVAVLVRLDLRERGRRSGQRDLERYRAWKARRRRTRGL